MTMLTAPPLPPPSARKRPRNKKVSKQAAPRVRLKKTLVTAGMAGLASRRAIRAVLILLGVERA